MSRFKKKKEAEVVEEVKDEVIEANEVVIEAADEIPEDAEVVDEVIIEPIEEPKEEVKEEKPAKKKAEEVKEEPKTEEAEPPYVDDLVILIKNEDYEGNPVDEPKAYRVCSICGDKVQLKYKGLRDICVKLDNLTKVGK